MNDDSFFSRWSRRKAQARQGADGDEPALADQASAETPPGSVGMGSTADRRPEANRAATTGERPADVAGVPRADGAEDVVRTPAPTLDDVAGLTPESDFSRFVGRDVSSEVRNAAVKKLFADPHFNVMDGLDIYIDDYAQPSPLSATQLAGMVGAQFLKLVEEPAATATAIRTAGGSQEEAPAQSPAQTGQKADGVSDEMSGKACGQTHDKTTDETSHDHADLQLQPDDAAGRQSPGNGTG
ncbi:MAG: DUF3306 domain-containing protein [Burkholderiaceae bacterium]